MELKFSREYVTSLLGSGVCNVCFFKLDGSVREMRATRCSQFIPKEKFGDPSKNYNGSAVRVYDMDLNEWRSFVLENLTAIEAV